MSAALMVPSRIGTSYSWPVRLSRTVRLSPVVLVLEAVAVLSVTSAPRSFCPGRRSVLGKGVANVGGGRVQMVCQSRAIPRQPMPVTPMGGNRARFDPDAGATVILTVAAAPVLLRACPALRVVCAGRATGRPRQVPDQQTR